MKAESVTGVHKRFALREPIEWPTLLLIPIVYIAWLVCLYLISHISLLFILLLIPVITLHSSLQHELLHGHPFKNKHLNHLCGFFPLGIYIPYLRFKELHLKHHKDPNLTDPYDDPESFYWDPAAFKKMPAFLKLILTINNTLLGRLIIGPAIALIMFYKSELKLLAKLNPPLIIAWLTHLVGLILLFSILERISDFSPLLYLLTCYFAISILMLRTFLEHKAHKMVRERSVIIGDRGIFSFLFLNNNYHFVHHRHPDIPWYRLRKVYHMNKEKYDELNGHYYYKSYWEIIKLYAFSPKEPCQHPLMQDAHKQAAE